MGTRAMGPRGIRVMGTTHNTARIGDAEPFFPKIETIHISEHWVLFEDGNRLTIETYLDFEECVVDPEDAVDATSCFVEHPIHGWLQIDIEPEPVTFN